MVLFVTFRVWGKVMTPVPSGWSIETVSQKNLVKNY